jgi:hypothetical protein
MYTHFCHKCNHDKGYRSTPKQFLLASSPPTLHKYIDSIRNFMPIKVAVLKHELSSPTGTLRSWVRKAIEVSRFVCVYSVLVLFYE